MQYNPYLLKGKEYFTTTLFRVARELEAQGKDIIKLIMGDPLEDTYAPVREAAIAALQARTYSQYPANWGSEAYRQAVADWAKAYEDIDLVPHKHILSCNGSKEAIFHLPILFDWTAGQTILMASMSYPVYASSAGMLHIPVQELPISEASNFMPDLDAIATEDLERCQLFWINSPHNPTTAIASRDYLEKLLGLAEKHDFMVISDECYNELYYDEKPTSCLQFTDSQRWIVFRSLSKRSHMTGYRAGAIISKNEKVIELMSRMRAPMGVGTPDFIQAGAIKAWQDHQHPRQFAESYRAKRDVILPALEAKGFHVFGAKAGFYIWFCHPDIKSSQAICDAFIEAGLLIVPGPSFGDDGDGYARITYCSKMPEIEEVARRIEQVKL